MLTAEDILKSRGGALVTVSPDATVLEAVRSMTTHNVGSVLVFEGTLLVGIWTERDLLHQTPLPGFQAATARMRDHMVRNLVYTPHDDTVYELMDKLLGRRHRRLLITREGVFVGLLTAGDVMRAFMQHKQRELEGLNALVSWDYYEEWRWTKESGKIERPATKTGTL